MPALLKTLGSLIAGSALGSTQKATLIVKGGRTIYAGSATLIILAWYSAWRNERVDASLKGKFPFPGLTNLKAKNRPDRPDKDDLGWMGSESEQQHGTSGNLTPGTEGPGDTAGPAVKGLGPIGLSKMISWCHKVSGKWGYSWGGGHGQVMVPSLDLKGSGIVGYDCSGAVSGALAAAGLLSTPLVSGSLASWGDPGPGKYVTIYANSVHTFMKINVNGTWRWFGTGSGKKATRGGVAWGNWDPDLGDYSVRHPRGY